MNSKCVRDLNVTPKAIKSRNKTGKTHDIGSVTVSGYVLNTKVTKVKINKLSLVKTKSFSTVCKVLYKKDIL